MKLDTELEELFEFAKQLSMNTMDRPTDWRGQQASNVFSKCALTSLWLLHSLPGSRFYGPIGGMRVNDITVAASHCRNLMECYYVLSHLLQVPSSADRDEFDRLLWNFNCAHERYEVLRILNADRDSDALKKAEKLRDDSKRQFEQSVHLRSLSGGHQEKVLKGETFKLDSSIELSRISGVSEMFYRSHYKYCSNFVHCTPFSVLQMDSARMGSRESEVAFGNFRRIASGYMALAVRDFCALFSDQEIPLNLKDVIGTWEGVFKWEKQPWFANPT